MPSDLEAQERTTAKLHDLTGKVAIVTGGGTGIGAATALLLARQGADVVVASRTADELERSAAAIREASGRRCLAVPTDVKDEAQVVQLVERTIAEFGRIDILINNAGGTRMGPLSQLPTKGWDASFDLNVKSAYFCTREAGRHMLAQGSGAIVNVSSDAGVHGVMGGAHYASAKAALQMFTSVTAAEWGPHGVRANCVAVGLIASPRAAEAWRVAGIDPQAVSARAPLRRPGRPDEVAQAILFFVSDASSYITGQTISVDGGPTMGGIPNC
jgi:3-oxoacyl-[acyl-carrier protein] reductase